MRRKSDETHRYIPSGDAPDHAGRVPCRRCGIPDWSYQPINEHHKNYIAPETDDSRIIGEREEVSDDAA